MKKIFQYIGFAILACAVAGCYGVEPHSYNELSPITINASSDTINVNLGETLVYNGLDVVSSLDVTYEWAYGAPKAGTDISQHTFSSVEVISDTRTIDYAFSKVGSYILRLKADNGESIVYKFFTLNVNSGYDEGVAILCNDEEGNGSLAFVRTLTQEDIAKGEQQVFSNIFSVEGKQLKNGTSLYMGHNTYNKVTYSGFVIGTADEEGTIYQMDCKTFELYAVAKASEFDAKCAELGGEYAEDKASFGCFFRSQDGRLFRYDMDGGFINEMTDLTYKIDRCLACIIRSGSISTAKTTRTPFFFNEEYVGTRKTSSAGIHTLYEDGWKVVNVAFSRSYELYPIHVLFQSKTDPTSYMVKVGGVGWYNWGTKKDDDNNTREIEYTFTAQTLNMDKNSKIIGSFHSSDSYYIYNNAIYRWNRTSVPGSRPAITLPDGEIIRDIATNHMGRASYTGEDLLYVATYNPSRTGEHKGSLYVYNFSDDTLAAKYEGICDDPAAVIYKYRIN